MWSKNGRPVSTSTRPEPSRSTDSSIDVSDVDVDTDQVARRVTLKGRVRSAAVRDKVIDLTREAAPGYTIDNELTIR